MAMPNYFDFEKPIEVLDRKIRELTAISSDEVDLKSEVATLEKKVEKIRKEIFNSLSRWQTAQVARHGNRPFALDYIKLIFTDLLSSTATGLDRDHLESLKGIFAAHQGGCRSLLHIVIPEKSRTTIRLPESCKVTACEELALAVKELLGYNAVTFE